MVIIFASFLLSLEGVRARLREVLLEVHLGDELDIRCPSEGDSVVVEGELVCSALLVLVAAVPLSSLPSLLTSLYLRRMDILEGSMRLARSQSLMI